MPIYIHQPTVQILNLQDAVLQNMVPDTVFLGYRQCYLDNLPEFIDKEFAHVPQEDRLKFVVDRMKEGHESPIEHAVITFLVTGVSRVESHQHVRHRIASYSQKSQRYVDHKNMKVILPPSIRKNPKAMEIYDMVMKVLEDSYGQLSDLVPKEDARFILPNATETAFVFTMNLRSLKNFLAERCCSNAQWEIRAVANQLLDQLRERSPFFNHFGPKCHMDGFCKEHKKRCCGKAPHISDIMNVYQQHLVENG